MAKGKRAALGILACTLTALVCQSSLDLPFVFDDRTTVLLNPVLVDRWDLGAVLFHGFPRTVVNLSYAIDRALWGFSSFGFHVTNFILHLVVVGLFYGWCTRALADQGPGSDQGQTGVRPGSDRGQTRVRAGSDPGLTPAPEWPAFFAAVVFGLHPLMGATTAYVSARPELLCAAGFLAALTFGRKAVRGSSARNAVLATSFGAIAVMSDPSGAALPIVMLAYDGWVLKADGWTRRLWRVYLPVTAAAALLAASPLRQALSIDRVPPRGLFENLLTESVVVWRYAGLLLVPIGQALVHGVRWAASPVDPIGLVALAGIVAAIVAAVRVRDRAPLAGFGLIWFFAALAPTSTIVPLGAAMAEPRTYVAAAGLILAAASLLARPLATRPAVRVAAACALAVLAVVTHARNAVWAEPLQLWEESVQRSPRAWQAHLGYADALREIHQCARAIPEYETALRLNPDQDAVTRDLQQCRAAAK